MATAQDKIANHISPNTGTKGGVKQQCAACKKDRSSRCGSCKDIYFCGKDCMESAWPEHKKVCATDELEKAVLRAGWLLQKLYMFARQHANTEHYHEVHWEGNRMNITYNVLAAMFRKPARPTGITEQERMMILAAGKCKGTLVQMSGISQRLLKGENDAVAPSLYHCH